LNVPIDGANSKTLMKGIVRIVMKLPQLEYVIIKGEDVQSHLLVQKYVYFLNQILSL